MSGHPHMPEDDAGPREAPAAASLTFEAALARLEEIVMRIESGDAGLEESLRLFEEGIALARTCRVQLDRAEARIRVLLEDADGELAEHDFAAPPAGGPDRGAQGEGDNR